MVQVALEFYIITFQRNEVGTWYVASIFELKVQRIKIKDSMKNNKKKPTTRGKYCRRKNIL